MFTIRHEHHHFSHNPDLREVKIWIDSLRDLIMKGFRTMADKSAELQAAFDDLAATFTTLATDIDNQLKIIANPGTPDAAVDRAIANAQALVASMKDKAAALEADDPPTPTP